MVSIFLCLALIAGSTEGAAAPSSLNYLTKVMDRSHASYYDVYTDSHSAYNHFVSRGRFPKEATNAWVPPMQECFPADPANPKPVKTAAADVYVDINWIECTYNSTQELPEPKNFGGWYFMNGVLTGEMVEPDPNWGEETHPNAGILDLLKATKISFWAKGAKGGERVEFFCCGVGWNPDTGKKTEKYPDSSPKVSLGYITLSNKWKYYEKSLAGKNLSYVLGGFGWVTNGAHNNNQDIKFYLDDIRFYKARAKDLRFMVSYTTEATGNDFDIVMRNPGFTYDNAAALLAFLAQGKKDKAKLLADALVYALDNDRYYRNGDYTAPDSKRLRNGYQAGDLKLWPGWEPHGFKDTARMPGFPLPGRYPNTGPWYEDEFQVSTHTGNVAWAMLALLGYYEVNGRKAADSKYLEAVKYLGEWVTHHCQDNNGPGGYTGGYEGWELPLPGARKLTYKATEHNIDLFVAFWRLYYLTNDQKWQTRAEHARGFVNQMWENGHFWTGTTENGVSINKDVIPLDIHSWAYLARLAGHGALDYAETHHRINGGYDFNEDLDGIWYEGTGQMAVAYSQTGIKADKISYSNILAIMHGAQYSHGGLPAASKDGLTTGFLLPDGKTPWLYYHRAHVGATAWLALAEKKVNPFWMGFKKPLPTPIRP